MSDPDNEFVEELKMVWRNYALADDSELSKSAIEFKRGLRGVVGWDSSEQRISELEAEIEMQTDLMASIKWSEQRIAELEAALGSVISQGHNNECLFCGFKDRIAQRALKREARERG